MQTTPAAVTTRHPLLELDDLSVAEKAALIQNTYPALHDHPSGIYYSMMKIDGDRIRPFQPADFTGITSFDFKNWRIKPEGPWEYRNNENSITTSGIWLAAQCQRFRATGDAETRAEARRVFGSLRTIYQFGVDDGRRGWMGKPYGFRLSDQTSPDQYLDAMWGLWLYLEIASDEEADQARAMLVAFADYWREVDYQLFYLDRIWDCRTEHHAYNAIFVMMQAVAHKVTGHARYREEAERIMASAAWIRESRVEAWRREILEGNAEDWPPNRLAGDHLRPGEFVCWEMTVHAKFAAIAASVIHQIFPELVDATGLATTLESWWKTWSLGTGEDLLPFYFFLVDGASGSWRPAERSPRLPKEEWFLGQPGLSHTTTRRWNEPLARFMVTSVLAGAHAPRIAEEAKALARRLLESIDATRIQWQVDPDGHQIDPEMADTKHVLSSEIPGSYVYTYWSGKNEGWW